MILNTLNKFKNIILYPFIRSFEYVLNINHNNNKNDNMFLLNNYKPIMQENEIKLVKIQGKVPGDLNGVYLRNGPNPKQKIEGKYHWFDGDGMIHSIKIKDGELYYSNRYLRTDRFKIEESQKRSVFLKIGDMEGLKGLLKIMFAKVKQMIRYDPKFDELKNGTSNTALLNYNQSVFALVESDLPLEIKIDPKTGVITTLSYFNFNNQLKHSFTAHPKVDQRKGELVFFGYNIKQNPYVNYAVADKNMNVICQMGINLKRPIMMHDFCITENYSIICDLPLVFEPKRIMNGDFVFHFDEQLSANYGVFPRYCTDQSQIIWFQLPSHMVFHYLAAFEDLNKSNQKIIKIYACYQQTFQFNFGLKTQYNKGQKQEKAQLYEIILNLDSRKAEVCNLLQNNDCQLFGDFPVINSKYVGYKCRYGYVSTFMNQKGEELATPDFNGFYKYDLQEKKVLGRVILEKGYQTGEVYFQEREGAQREDDGYLMTIAYDNNTSSSYFLLWDSLNLTQSPLLKVLIPSRIPYGFHSTFIPQKHILQQQINKL